jgi:hypothetical protein
MDRLLRLGQTSCVSRRTRRRRTSPVQRSWMHLERRPASVPGGACSETEHGGRHGDHQTTSSIDLPFIPRSGFARLIRVVHRCAQAESAQIGAAAAGNQLLPSPGSLVSLRGGAAQSAKFVASTKSAKLWGGSTTSGSSAPTAGTRHGFAIIVLHEHGGAPVRYMRDLDQRREGTGPGPSPRPIPGWRASCPA